MDVRIDVGDSDGAQLCEFAGVGMLAECGEVERTCQVDRQHARGMRGDNRSPGNCVHQGEQQRGGLGRYWIADLGILEGESCESESQHRTGAWGNSGHCFGV